jgi:hypothetical protein
MWIHALEKLSPSHDSGMLTFDLTTQFSYGSTNMQRQPPHMVLHLPNVFLQSIRFPQECEPPDVSNTMDITVMIVSPLLNSSH